MIIKDVLNNLLKTVPKDIVDITNLTEEQVINL